MAVGSLWLGAPAAESFNDFAGRTMAYALPCALLVYGAACVEIDSGAKAPAGAVALGDWSYSLYLLHFILLAVLARLWADRFGGAWDNLGFAVLGAALSILCAWLSFRWFERPALAAGNIIRARLFPRRGAAPGATPRLASRIW
jgi:peptidoglycan/LPS O-acetylase OafA/YrhL